MFLNLSHTNLDLFKVSRSVTLLCYKETKNFPADEKFAMMQQIRRAALSVHLNISEGSSRKSTAERKRFYEIARGSLVEVDTAFDIAVELNYTTNEQLQELGSLLIRCFQMLSKMIGA
jgi:four helix bundle protein